MGYISKKVAAYGQFVLVTGRIRIRIRWKKMVFMLTLPQDTVSNEW